MNLGLGNLAALKTALLPDTLQDNVDFDALIAQIGTGVAGQFDAWCNRRFARTLGAGDTFSADRTYWIARCFPIEQVTSLQTKWGMMAAEDVTSSIAVVMEESGLVDFGGMLGDSRTRGVLIYDGGYWIDESEDGSGVLPAGATTLPAHIAQAWIVQCKHVFECYDVLGKQLTKGGAAKDSSNIKLLEVVQQILSPEIRILS